jgi:hypothetical protein
MTRHYTWLHLTDEASRGSLQLTRIIVLNKYRFILEAVKKFLKKKYKNIGNGLWYGSEFSAYIFNLNNLTHVYSIYNKNI